MYWSTIFMMGSFVSRPPESVLAPGQGRIGARAADLDFQNARQVLGAGKHLIARLLSTGSDSPVMVA